MIRKTKTIDIFIFAKNEVDEFDIIFQKYQSLLDSNPELDITISTRRGVSSIIDNREKSYQIIYQINF